MGLVEPVPKRGGELPPPVLFMYCSEPSRRFPTHKLLVERQIRVSAWHKLNDPFDCFPVLAQRTSKSTIWKYLSSRPDLYDGPVTDAMVKGVKKRIDEGGRNPRAFWTETVISKGVICMSERNDGVLMWSHYASSHRGFAVGFRSLEMWQSPPGILFHKVDYGGRRPRFNANDLGLNREDRYQMYLSLMVRKSVEWRYEKEWRSVVDRPHLREGLYLPFTPEAVDSMVPRPRDSADDHTQACGGLSKGCAPRGRQDLPDALEHEVVQDHCRKNAANLGRARRLEVLGLLQRDDLVFVEDK